ncbi:MAG: hypothetical protein F4Y60_09715 [Boseongicola sp. SB0664_bin_43]|uniref:Uncharacterized protein n=1 Tax=Boseongicola sp. SB0664_bin_43 TaxID=2604844 RepID=A0A6B0Y2P2_9RHOB|nr:hypothetical protein [Boseongicola sp. SB0664_bin_43]MYK31019.1 hypothetical protein [Boseongicola sp. SB0670_bin_30]
MPLATHELNPGPSARHSPPVVATVLGRPWRLDGRRLGLLGSTTLQVRCSCGHSGAVPVAELMSRHGRDARVRDAVASMRCGSCGSRDLEEVRWLG